MILDYFTQEQLNSNWCWAAVGSSISNFYNSESFWPQKELAAQMLNMPSCITNPGNPGCNLTLNLSDVLTFLGHYAGETDGAVTLKTLQEFIEFGNPVCCQFQMNQHATHFVSVFGFINNDIYVGDPQVGNYKVKYDSFFNYRGGTWIRSIATVE